MNNFKLLKIISIAILLIFTHACQDTQSKIAAPLGDNATLEKLAHAYRTVATNLMVSPSGLTPKGKLKFVEQVFKQAGYDYSATLQALANIQTQDAGKAHKDIMELLFLPQMGIAQGEFESLFDDADQVAIQKIRKNMQ